MKNTTYTEGAHFECTGTVEYFHENPHGDIDGIYLDDGSEIRFPPHLGGHFFDEIHFGQEIAVKATVHITKHEDVHLHAHEIVDTASGEILLEREPHVHKPKRPKHEQQGEGAALNAEILHELRAIRELLEAQQNRD